MLVALVLKLPGAQQTSCEISGSGLRLMLVGGIPSKRAIHTSNKTLLMALVKSLSPDCCSFPQLEAQHLCDAVHLHA